MSDARKSTRKVKIRTIILSLVFLCIATFYAAFFNEVNTLLSIRKLNDNPAYKLTYKGDYALDKYLENGADDWDKVLDFMNENLARGIGKHLYGENQCSSFFAMTPDGDYILARNLDAYGAIPAVITTNPSADYRAIGVTNISRGGWSESSLVSRLTAISSPYYTLDGINEHGLAIASSSIPTDVGTAIDESKVVIHDLTVNRVVLDKAKNVKEAIDLLSEFNIKMEKTYPSHYMIADADGNCVVIEYINGEMKVLEMVGEFHIATNFAMYDYDYNSISSCFRYNDYKNALSDTDGIISTDEAMELLKNNVVKGQAQWSVVYNLTKRTMTITFNNHYDVTYEYELIR